MLKFENKAKRKGFAVVIGVDEAGRGPLAGPVVASAVKLHTTSFHSRIDDSKKLSPRERQDAFIEIFEKASVGVGIMSESVIDEVNILEATFLAMSNAIEELMPKLSINNNEIFPNRVCLLIDGNRFKSELPYPFWTIVKGDSLSLSIACASIVAKVIRDRILNCYDQVFPQYGFKAHKGYPTLGHRQAIRKFGTTPIHRQSFHYSL